MWTSKFTVKFVPLPQEMEEAYWAAIRYFAELLLVIIEEDAKTAESNPKS